MSTIESVLHETRVFPPSDVFTAQANVSGMQGYQALTKAAEEDYEGFWADLARANITWNKPFTRTLDESNAPFYKWFEDGELNVSYNCLDKHLTTQPEKTALIFEADDGTVTKASYRELHARVCQFANALKARGIGVDTDAFNAAMQQQKAKARAAWAGSGDAAYGPTYGEDGKCWLTDDAARVRGAKRVI